MTTALLVLLGVGLVMSALLAVGKKAFAVTVDEKFEQLMELLPGANCGGCGYPGCSGYAGALLSGSAPASSCPPGGADLTVEIGKIMGMEVELQEPMVALVACAGSDAVAPLRSNYQGIDDCRAAHAVAGGAKSCTHGCLGLGSCITVCKFGAITTTGNGLVVVNPDKCTGCKACVETCPRGIIKMVKKSTEVHVLCNNPDKAKAVKAVCEVGCTGCKLCSKQSKRLVIDGALARVDDSCDDDIPESCALVCPQGAIFDSRYYKWNGWLTDKAVRDDFQTRSDKWKSEEKERKAAAKVKAKAAREAKAKDAVKGVES